MLRKHVRKAWRFKGNEGRWWAGLDCSGKKEVSLPASLLFIPSKQGVLQTLTTRTLVDVQRKLTESHTAH